MGWADTVKATALKILAERTETPDRASTNTLWTWSPYDVWLSRVRPPLDSAEQPTVRDPVTQPRPKAAPRD
jgi:hypothetical protein